MSPTLDSQLIQRYGESCLLPDTDAIEPQAILRMRYAEGHGFPLTSFVNYLIRIHRIFGNHIAHRKGDSS